MPSEEYLKRKKAYILKYQKNNYKMIAIKCRYDNDRDILDALKASGNASEYAKKAVREFMAKGGKL